MCTNRRPMEEYQCPSAEAGIRSKDQKIDQLALRTYQLQQYVSGDAQVRARSPLPLAPEPGAWLGAARCG